MDTDSDLEDIDLESTEVSDQDADKEYEVEKILASKDLNGQDRYLVLWKGYPIERSTWEPLESFNDPNTVHEWRKTAARQKKGLEPPYDWREWDRQRLEEERRTIERRRKRELKRQRSGWVRRQVYRSDSELEGFVVDDDVVTSDDHSGSSSESELDPPERTGKRKKASTSNESGEASDDSLMRATRRKELRLKKRLKPRRRSSNASEKGSGRSSPRLRTAERNESRKKSEKRKRVGSPSELLSGAARNLSLEATRHGKNKHHDADRQVKKQRLQAAIKIVARPSRPGPSRLKQRRTLANPAEPNQVKTFTSLSHVNRVYKAGKNEPPPDLTKIELFAPGQPSRVLPPIPRRTSFPHVNHASEDSMAHTVDRPPSPAKVNKAIPYANFKIPKRRATLPAHGLAQSLTPHDDDESHTGFSSNTLSRRVHETAEDGARGHRGSLPSLDVMDIDDALPQTMPPRPLMESHTVKSFDPRVFVCNLVQGPRATLIGEARLTGFSTTFVEELYNKTDCRTLWISKFYGQNYLKEYFAPHFGIPLHVAAIEIDPAQVQPLINALIFLKGAGVVIHADFTMLVFLPSNNDLDRQAFKLPQVPVPGSSKSKPALRVVVYPSLEGISFPSRELNHEIQIQGNTQAADPLPWWEGDLRLSLPAYLASTTNVNWDEIFETEKEANERAKGKEIKETYFIFLYPPIAESESKEYKHALECLNKKVVDLKHLRTLLQTGRGALERFTFFIHQSLRRQLHLLPDIVRDRRKEARSYWLYGTKIDQSVDQKPQKIWTSGTIIFITPQLIVSSPEGFKSFMAYAERKAATTKLALPSIWEEKVMEVMKRKPAEEVLMHVFDIKEKIGHGIIILISVDLYPECNELEVYVDEFALYQLDNPFQFRRYWFGHPSLPDTEILELYKNIEFYTPELAKAQLYQESKRTQQELRNKQAHAHTSSTSAVRKELPEGSGRRQ